MLITLMAYVSEGTYNWTNKKRFETSKSTAVHSTFYIVLDLNLEKIWRGLISGAGGEVGGGGF